VVFGRMLGRSGIKSRGGELKFRNFSFRPKADVSENRGKRRMRYVLAGLSALLIGLTPLCAKAQAESCDVNRDEISLMHGAPGKVRRLPSEHTLVVNYKGGVKRFVDAPPYDEELSGLHWRYCTFVQALNAYLIGMSKDGLFSGKLLLDENGRLLDAGHTVYPSPDGTKFLAVEQEDGMDGELWTVSDMTGRKLWSGYAGTKIPQQPRGKPDMKPYEAIESNYELPRWTGQGQLQANQVCAAGTLKRVITLKLKDGAWSWKPSIHCAN